MSVKRPPAVRVVLTVEERDRVTVFVALLVKIDKRLKAKKKKKSSPR